MAPTRRHDEHRVPSSASATRNREQWAGYSQQGQSPLLQTASSRASGHQSGPSSRLSQSRTKSTKAQNKTGGQRSKGSQVKISTITPAPLMKQAIGYRDENDVSPLSSDSGNGDDTLVSPSQQLYSENVYF
jgi:hypothetical protein